MQANELTLHAAREHEARLSELAAPARVGAPHRPKNGARPARRVRARRLVIVLSALAALAITATAGRSAATAPALEPETLMRARAIGSELTARYRLLPGRKLVVTETAPTGVVSTLTLVIDWLEPRVVPANNGIYFAICSARARCPYPPQSAVWRAGAFLPRRLALELALRTFAETGAALVVVALPTAEPVWVVFERDDLLADDEASPLLPDLVARLTLPRLFRPVPMLPPPRDTIYAVRLLAP